MPEEKGLKIEPARLNAIKEVPLQSGTLVIIDQAHYEMYPRQAIETAVRSSRLDSLMLENVQPESEDISKQIGDEDIQHQLRLASELHIPVIIADPNNSKLRAFDPFHRWFFQEAFQQREIEDERERPYQTAGSLLGFATAALLAKNYLEHHPMTRRQFIKLASLTTGAILTANIPGIGSAAREFLGILISNYPGNVDQNSVIKFADSLSVSLEDFVTGGNFEDFTQKLRNFKFLQGAELTSQYLKKTGKSLSPRVGLVVGYAHRRHLITSELSQAEMRALLEGAFMPIYRRMKLQYPSDVEIVNHNAALDLVSLTVSAVGTPTATSSEATFNPEGVLISRPTREMISLVLEKDSDLLASYSQWMKNMDKKSLN